MVSRYTHRLGARGVMKRPALLAVLSLAAACAAPLPPEPRTTPSQPLIRPTPTSTLLPTPTPTNSPQRTASARPSATPVRTATVIRVPIARIWEASCVDVPEEVCGGVARRYVNLVGPIGVYVLNASEGNLLVEPRPSCPAEMRRDVDPAFCWQVDAEGTSDLCMVFARYVGDDRRYADYLQVGGPTPGTIIPSRLPSCV